MDSDSRVAAGVVVCVGAVAALGGMKLLLDHATGSSEPSVFGAVFEVTPEMEAILLARGAIKPAGEKPPISSPFERSLYREVEEAWLKAAKKLAKELAAQGAKPLLPHVAPARAVSATAAQTKGASPAGYDVDLNDNGYYAILKDGAVLKAEGNFTSRGEAWERIGELAAGAPPLAPQAAQPLAPRVAARVEAEVAAAAQPKRWVRVRSSDLVGQDRCANCNMPYPSHIDGMCPVAALAEVAAAAQPICPVRVFSTSLSRDKISDCPDCNKPYYSHTNGVCPAAHLPGTSDRVADAVKRQNDAHAARQELLARAGRILASPNSTDAEIVAVASELGRDVPVHYAGDRRAYLVDALQAMLRFERNVPFVPVAALAPHVAARVQAEVATTPVLTHTPSAKPQPGENAWPLRDRAAAAPPPQPPAPYAPYNSFLSRHLSGDTVNGVFVESAASIKDGELMPLRKAAFDAAMADLDGARARTEAARDAFNVASSAQIRASLQAKRTKSAEDVAAAEAAMQALYAAQDAHRFAWGAEEAAIIQTAAAIESTVVDYLDRDHQVLEGEPIKELIRKARSAATRAANKEAAEKAAAVAEAAARAAAYQKRLASDPVFAAAEAKKLAEYAATREANNYAAQAAWNAGGPAGFLSWYRKAPSEQRRFVKVRDYSGWRPAQGQRPVPAGGCDNCGEVQDKHTHGECPT